MPFLWQMSVLTLELEAGPRASYVSWTFKKLMTTSIGSLLETLSKRGFGGRWLRWMMFCISTVKFSVSINGTPTGFFSSQKGLRQGDPFSPFLFIIAMEGLKDMLKIAQEKLWLRGFRVSSRVGADLEITHLQYADDTLVFCDANKNQLKILRDFGLKDMRSTNYILGDALGSQKQIYRHLEWGAKLEGLAGRIEFVNISFYYPSRVKNFKATIRKAYTFPTEQVPVLQHINFVVHPGEVVALVGLSGSGKSTLVNLLLRLYEPISGQICIDGYPIRDLNIKWLRERIGYVGQEPRLFRMDISSNIRYGCSRDVNQQDVEWAAKEAAAHDFISSLPNGYHTIVDNDLLSGGQKQRIAIARAILRDPDILVLDEATSALDAESEHNIKGVLHAVRRELNSKRTVIVIAHRLSTIQAADKIVVMESGKVVEMGSHKELLLNDGLYARLTRRQADAVA
ncbi:hypothetical protein MTR67_051807 [Solanum verrucosum]|uniref:ABC transporter domain-containing protein n=1 Tax=Solanum verrucosum TaxID=315347 RepID=A0AAF0V5P0_SOLVR|nr:hypothetical protein MTR67_051807 [Solanum verrucosum]